MMAGWFRRFLCEVMDSKGRMLGTCWRVCHRGHAPKETFARAQLDAISSIYTDFMCFPTMDFRWNRVWACAIDALPLKKPLLDLSWILLHRFLRIAYVFIRFHEISWIPGVECLKRVCPRVPASKETFARIRLVLDFRELNTSLCMSISSG